MDITRITSLIDALDSYLPKLIRAGHRVAICDDITVFGKQKASKKRTKKQEASQELFTTA